VVLKFEQSFNPFREEGSPIGRQFMNWNEMVRRPYDKKSVDAYTRTRTILMNGIENNSVLTSHAIARLTKEDGVKEVLGLIRRVDSQHQQTVNWLTPANQSILETTLGYEQVAVDLTANLAKNERNECLRQVLDFALLEDFDHLYRYSLLAEILEGVRGDSITQGKTEIKPGRPTAIEHRHPVDEMRKHFRRDEVDTRTWLNYYTIVSAEQQTELYYKSHGFMFSDDMARKLYAEIAEIEEQHVSQYEAVGDPTLTDLEALTLIQLNEAYNYYSCYVTEPDQRLKGIWERFMRDEITHFNMCAELLKKQEGKEISDLIPEESIAPPIVFEPNKEYVNRVLDEQLDLQPYNMEFLRESELPKSWASYRYREVVNAGGVPSEEVVERHRQRR